MIIQNKIPYIAIKFSEETNNKESIYFQSKKEFKGYQDLGYNIYYILNDFYRRRTKEDLIGFKYIGIDLDCPIGDKKDLQSVIETFSSRGFPIFKINETFKGYHIFFKLSPELYDMHPGDYEDLYNHLNELIGGDEAMKSITGILKMENTIDIKNNRNFIIETKYRDSTGLITKKSIFKVFGREITFDSKRRDSHLAKKEKRQRNMDFINDIDSKKFLADFNNYFPERRIEIKSNLHHTGIKLFKYKGKYNINDFTNKKRGGNYNFLFKVLLKGLEDTDFNTLNRMLKKEYNYAFGYSIKKEPYFNHILGIDYKKLIGRKNTSLEEKGYGFKVLRAIFYLDYQDLEISRKNICNILNIKGDNIQYKKVDKAMMLLASLKYSPLMFTERQQSHLILLDTYEGLRKEKLYKITFPQKIRYSPVWGNIDVFKIIKKNSKMSFLVFEILDNISLYGSYKYSVSHSIRVLDSQTLNDDTQKNTLRRILLSMKKEDLINKYSMKKDMLIVN